MSWLKGFLHRAVFAGIVCAGFLCRAEAESPAALRLSKTIPLRDVSGRIDHMAVDTAGGRLFVAALGNNTVEVVDLRAGKRIESLRGFAEPQGIAYVPESNQLFVANGGDGTCRIIDGNSFHTIRKVEFGNDADNVRYDRAHQKVYVGYGEGALAVIDPPSGAKLGNIPLRAHPESFQVAADGKIFVNLPHARQIAVVDAGKNSVAATWLIEGAKENFPMALDEANHWLFVGCRSPAKVLVLDSRTGRAAASFKIGGDTDDLFFDAEKKIIYVSCGAGQIDVVKQLGREKYQVLPSIRTASGARTSLWIPERKEFCVAVPQRGGQPAEIRIYTAP